MKYVNYQGPNENNDSDPMLLNQFGDVITEGAAGFYNGVQNIADMGVSGTNTVFGIVQSSEETLLSPLDDFLSWKPWELFLRLVTIALFIYVVYQMIYDNGSRNMTNYLLLLIVLNSMVQIHQNINVQKTLANH